MSESTDGEVNWKASYFLAMQQLEAANERAENWQEEARNYCKNADYWKLEAEKLQVRIDESQKQEPVAYSVGNTLQWHTGAGLTNAELYAKPIIQPDVDALYNRIDFWKSECNKHLVENAELRKQLEEKVPEGWQLVPKEPTHKILSACIDVEIGDSDYLLTLTYEEAKEIYKAMLAAAPQPKEKP